MQHVHLPLKNDDAEFMILQNSSIMYKYLVRPSPIIYDFIDLKRVDKNAMRIQTAGYNHEPY